MPRTAVVTGAASGLGLALVWLLVQRGDHVVGIDLLGDERQATIESTGASFVGCDVTDFQQWTSAAAAINKKFSAIDLAFLNAGVMTRNPAQPIDDDPIVLAATPGYRKVFGVNVDGVIFGVTALAPHLSSNGSITITASTAALGALPFDPYYAATKHAVAGYVKSAGPTFIARGQRINALCPGGIDTNIVPGPLRASMPTASFRPPYDVARALVAVSDHDGSGVLFTLTDDDILIAALN
jgi:NAD(P)-dependent dehydrogenase (short-subunit alcohol dehydrogenase family)